MTSRSSGQTIPSRPQAPLFEEHPLPKKPQELLSFEDLPEDLLGLIAAIVCEATGRVTVGRLRQVCKAWRGADFCETAARCPAVLVARLTRAPPAIAAEVTRMTARLYPAETCSKLLRHAIAAGRAGVVAALHAAGRVDKALASTRALRRAAAGARDHAGVFRVLAAAGLLAELRAQTVDVLVARAALYQKADILEALLDTVVPSESAAVRALEHGSLELFEKVAAIAAYDASARQRIAACLLTQIVNNGDLPKLQLLVRKYGVTAEILRANDNLLLQQAACAGQAGIMRELAECGLTSADARANHNLALRKACTYNKPEAIEVLADVYKLTIADVLDRGAGCAPSALECAVCGPPQVLAQLSKSFSKPATTLSAVVTPSYVLTMRDRLLDDALRGALFEKSDDPFATARLLISEFKLTTADVADSLMTFGARYPRHREAIAALRAVAAKYDSAAKHDPAALRAVAAKHDPGAKHDSGAKHDPGAAASSNWFSDYDLN